MEDVKKALKILLEQLGTKYRFVLISNRLRNDRPDICYVMISPVNPDTSICYKAIVHDICLDEINRFFRNEKMLLRTGGYWTGGISKKFNTAAFWLDNSSDIVKVCTKVTFILVKESEIPELNKLEEKMVSSWNTRKNVITVRDKAGSIGTGKRGFNQAPPSVEDNTVFKNDSFHGSCVVGSSLENTLIFVEPTEEQITRYLDTLSDKHVIDNKKDGACDLGVATNPTRSNFGTDEAVAYIKAAGFICMSSENNDFYEHCCVKKVDTDYSKVLFTGQQEQKCFVSLSLDYLFGVTPVEISKLQKVVNGLSVMQQPQDKPEARWQKPEFSEIVKRWHVFSLLGKDSTVFQNKFYLHLSDEEKKFYHKWARRFPENMVSNDVDQKNLKHYVSVWKTLVYPGLSGFVRRRLYNHLCTVKELKDMFSLFSVY